MNMLTEPYDDTILAGLEGELSRQAAEAILAIGFSDAQQHRMQQLAERTHEGRLSETEKSECESFGRVSSFLGVLHSKARMLLRDTAA